MNFEAPEQAASAVQELNGEPPVLQGQRLLLWQTDAQQRCVGLA